MFVEFYWGQDDMSFRLPNFESFLLSQGELPGWQGDGSNIGFPHLNFGSTEGSSQQNAPGVRIPFFSVVFTLA